MPKGQAPSNSKANPKAKSKAVPVFPPVPPHAKEAAESWHEYWDLHWDEGGEVPSTTYYFNADSEAHSFVEAEVLPRPDLEPILIKNEYPIILSKIVEKLDMETVPQGQPKSVLPKHGGHVKYTAKDLKHGPEEERKRPGTCIFGHPGSGKSTCLHYLLIAMLRRGQPVLFVERQRDRMVFFSDQGPASVDEKYITDLSIIDSPIVILYDALAGQIPSTWWGSIAVNFHVVLATSPQVDYFKNWIKNGVDCLTVEPFSREDVEHLILANPTRFGHPKKYHHILDVYDHLGPSLKLLTGARGRVLKGQKTTFVEDFEKKTEPLSEAIQHVPTDLWIKSATQPRKFMNLNPKDEPAKYHEIFVVRSVKEDGRSPWSEHPRFEVRLLSPFMVSVFIGAVQLRGFREQVAFAGRFVFSPSIRGMVFELSSIRFLSWAPKATGIVVNGHRNLKLSPYLPTALEFLNFDNQPPPRPKVLHVAPIGAASIDALYEMADGTKLLFQMTVAKKHPVSQTGLAQILKCYRTANSQISLEDFIFVFVVPDKETRDKYLKQHADGLSRKNGNDMQNLRVGAMIINTEEACSLEEILSKNDQDAFKVVDKKGKITLSKPIRSVTSGQVKAEASVPLTIGTAPATVLTTSSHRTSNRTSNSVISGDFLGDYANAPSPVSGDPVTSPEVSSSPIAAAAIIASPAQPLPLQPSRILTRAGVSSRKHLQETDEEAPRPSSPKRRRLSLDEPAVACSTPPLPKTRGSGQSRGGGGGKGRGRGRAKGKGRAQ